MQARNDKPKSGPLSEARWQVELARSVTDPVELLGLLQLPPGLAPCSADGAGSFPLRVPRPYVSRMRRGDPRDPLLLQVLARPDELAPHPGFTSDPVGDLAAVAAPGLLHKYRGRVLLVTTGACPVHCRYCFRRHFPYASTSVGRAQWAGAVEYIRADPSVAEVILSGGEPLMWSNARLAEIARRLAEIPHVRRLRIHTRFPVVIPSRVDDGLLDAIAGTRLQPVMVLHVNHANELDQEVEDAMRRASARGVHLLNQSVLLHGVNDSVPALVGLSERLFGAGALPYYLHLLDRVHGAVHFEVSEIRAVQLMAEVQRQLPGFLVPRLVREVQGRSSKQPLPIPVEPSTD
jgi:EF-P beta-lysylation protein EpmB